MQLKTLFVFLLLAICYMLYAGKIQASEFSLGVYPPILQIQATVPTIITKDITVVNASDQEQDVLILLRQFTQASSNNGQVAYLPSSQKPYPDSNILDRVQILDNGNPVTTLALSPKQKKTVTLRIGLPKDEPGADYYFSIIFQSSNSAIITTNGSHISAGIATNVLLSIGPKDITTGFLDAFSTPWLASTGPIPFTVLVTNNSRHFISPTGQILVRNMFGQLVGKIDLLSVNILGNSTRYIPSSIVNASHPVAYWNEKVLFGPYRANIVLSLSDQGPILTQTIYFFVMPWQYIVGFFLAVVILAIVVSRVRQRIYTN